MLVVHRLRLTTRWKQYLPCDTSHIPDKHTSIAPRNSSIRDYVIGVFSLLRNPDWFPETSFGFMLFYDSLKMPVYRRNRNASFRHFTRKQNDKSAISLAIAVISRGSTQLFTSSVYYPINIVYQTGTSYFPVYTLKIAYLVRFVQLHGLTIYRKRIGFWLILSSFIRSLKLLCYLFYVENEMIMWFNW